ncbi:hypothetical protein DRQ09_08930 [candidate division KSB1 bacterium]|nr:MAG: hypothetical protein DRQ09_08930 [candidate division KSB1 bacterium]
MKKEEEVKRKSIQRRDFIKQVFLGSTIISAGFSVPEVIARTEDGVLVESGKEYGGFVVEKLSNDKFPYKYNPDILKQMSEKYNVFSRNVWDPLRQNRPGLTENLMYERLVKGEGKIPNQTRLDYALYTGAWTFANRGGRMAYRWDSPNRMFKNLGKWNPADIGMTWRDASIAVKHAALFYGASLSGIAKLNPLWIYSDHFAPKRDDRSRAIPVYRDGDRFEQTEDAWYIPESMNRVIALAFEEDYYAIANSPGRLASAAVGNGYSRMAFTALTLAEFIRALGYRAIPAGNGVGLSIPIAIDAGLGELGRLGLLVTPKFGPRVRLAKVITDMPLTPDPPISFGVPEFCEECMLCAEYCPSGAITKGPRTWKGTSPSNNPGTYKWYVRGEKCYDFNGFSCSNCKRVCPFSKPNNSWLHQMIRMIVKKRVNVLDKLLVTLDQASGYGKQLQDTEFWKMDGSKSITARDYK